MSQWNEEPARASGPFDRDRDGFGLAEGAGVLVLEDLTHAQRRRARVYGELAGYGLRSDAHHYSRPDPEADGPARAMALAIKDAGASPDAIDYICPWDIDHVEQQDRDPSDQKGLQQARI